MRAAFTQIGWSVVVSALTACSGPAPGYQDTGAGQYTVLFTENFDNGLSTATWDVTGPVANFEIDSSVGASSAPSLKVISGTSAPPLPAAQLIADPFDADTKLEILFSAYVPAHPGAQGFTGTPLFEIVRESNGQSAARLELEVDLIGDVYFGYMDGSGTTNVPATLDQFVDFSFTVNSNGTSTWAKNGVDIGTTSPTGLQGDSFRLRLHAVRIAPWDVNFDDIEARKY